jgi:MoaA/NifB/PqqE/SkfB family radical SAM enzyme
MFDPSLDWIQVEITTYCNASCIYCPRTAYGEAWRNRHLPMRTFMKLAPAFRRAARVHLQGWGEPLMHPGFFEMADAAKAAGCLVGTTTNAVMFNREIASKVVESGIDLVAFSLAGTGEENDRIRKGTSLNRVLDAIRMLSEEKQIRRSQTPVIHIAYMLFRSGLNDLGGLLPLVKGLGVSAIVISTLDFVAAEELLPEVLHPETAGAYEKVASLLRSLAAEGEEQGIGIHDHLPGPERTRVVCTENVGRALCVSADGAVAPCVYTHLDLAGVSYFSQGERRPYRRMTFGNVNEQPLGAIWRKADYKAFRNSLRKGSPAVPCRGCLKLC